ncbi:MAG: hypothetical protein RLZZ628_3917 [Bacteroidota bacterium]|jgi:hypothetical protein
MNRKLLAIIEILFYIFCIYICLVWAKWLPRPTWLQEDVEPVYSVITAIGLFVCGVWRLRTAKTDTPASEKNIAKGKINAKKGIHIGDTVVPTTPENYNRKNSFEGEATTEGDFHLGDGK